MKDEIKNLEEIEHALLYCRGCNEKHDMKIREIRENIIEMIERLQKGECVR